MCDPTAVGATLFGIINSPDPKRADVAICHMRDAIAAPEAVIRGVRPGMRIWTASAMDAHGGTPQSSRSASDQVKRTLPI